MFSYGVKTWLIVGIQEYFQPQFYKGFKSVYHEVLYNSTSYTSVKVAYRVALAEANSNDLIVVAGSTFVIAEVVQLLTW